MSNQTPLERATEAVRNLVADHPEIQAVEVLTAALDVGEMAKAMFKRRWGSYLLWDKAGSDLQRMYLSMAEAARAQVLGEGQ